MRNMRGAILGISGAFVVILTVWAFMSIKVVDRNDVLVVVRRYLGKALPPDKTIAEAGEKGPRREALGPGFHFVAAWIHTTERFPITRVPQGMIGVRVARSGRPLPPGAVIAADDVFETREDGTRVLVKEGEKGIREGILKTGDHRINPYEFEVELYPAVEIPAGKVGVLVQLVGEPLPEGEIIAQADPVAAGSEALPRSTRRGMLETVLTPGTYYINPYVYHVELHDEVVIAAGTLGVQIRKVGREPKPDAVLVAEGERGIQERALSPGRYYLNPYVVEVAPISIRTQRYEARHVDGRQAGIEFPSLDAFPITADITLQWRIPAETVALTYATLGGIERIEEVLIEQNCHSVARMKGSNHTAKKFISGETRKQFENDIHADLDAIFTERGLLLERTLVRNIIIPTEIETPIQEARVAIEERQQYEEQTKEADSEAARQKEKKLADQRATLVQAQTAQIAVVNEAKMRQKTDVIAAQQKLEVAKVRLDAARKQAEALLKQKRAEANVELFTYQAEAVGYEGQVAALGGGEQLVRLELWQKIAPVIQAVIPMGEGTLWTGGEFLENILKLKGIQALGEGPPLPRAAAR